MVCGPLVGGLLAALDGRDELDADVWVVSELPITADSLPPELLAALECSRRLLVAEEHVATGSVGRALAHLVLSEGVPVDRFEHACAQGYPSGRYGSQTWHRRECGLDADAARRAHRVTRIDGRLGERRQAHGRIRERSSAQQDREPARSDPRARRERVRRREFVSGRCLACATMSTVRPPASQRGASKG